MKRFCLIGHPLAHSISPVIHERLFKLSGCECSYRLNELPPEGLKDGINSLKKLDGFNVTIPYKQAVIPYLDAIDERAERYNAVNTVKCGGGKTEGFNTDSVGFIKSLEFAGISLSGKVLLCGAGGVAHMMAYEALDRDCSLVIATPTISEAQRLCDELLVKYKSADISAQGLAYVSGSFDLILNGTPVGMFPNAGKMPVPHSVANSAAAVFDAVYNPCETRLVKTCKKAGAKAQGGLSMLVLQAAAAQEIWTGAQFKQDDLRNLIEEMQNYITENFNNK